MDVAALDFCFNDLQPRREELEDNASRLVWCNRVQTIRPTMQIMKELFKPQKDVAPDTLMCNFGQVSRQLMQSCRFVDLLNCYGAKLHSKELKLAKRTLI